MKAVYPGDSCTIINEITPSSPNDGELLIQLKSCGICGSDVEKIFGKYGKTSMRLGHEPAGVVTAIGKGVVDFKIGDRVFTHHHVSCMSCHLCDNNFETLCENYSTSNLEPCGLSEQYIVPKWNVQHGGVLKLPNSVSFDSAAMIEPLACCIRSWKKIKTTNTSVGIFGIGSTGMLHAMLAEHYDVEQIFCLDISNFRLDFAKKLVNCCTINSKELNRINQIYDSTDSTGLDLSIIATSSMTALSDAISATSKGGIIMMFGVPSKGAMLNIDMSNFYSKEQTLVTSYAASDMDTRAALNLITNGFDVDKLITHRYNITDSNTAFNQAHKGDDSMKIIIQS